MLDIVLDIETTGLNRFKDKINVTGIYVPKYEYYVPIFTSEQFISFLQSLPEKPHFITANGKFDMLFLEYQWNIKPEYIPIDDDIMIMSYILDMGKRKGLKDLAKRHCGAEDWDVDKKTKTGMSDEMLNYNRLDCYWTYQVYLKLKAKLDSDERCSKLYYALAMPVFRAYRNIERRGMYVDTERIKKMIPEINARADELLQQLKQVADINWNSNSQVAEVLIGRLNMPVLATTPKGAVSIGAEQLEDYSRMGYKIAEVLLEYKKLTKNVNTFLQPWLEQSVDSRLHPSFNIDTVRTGRTSCSDPNLQQVPRELSLRSLFTAPKGKQLFECDYSQLELRIACEYAKERTMMSAYLNNEDLHTKTAQICTGKLEVTKAERRDAKPVNFGFIYGMSAKGYVNYAKTGYGVIVTEQQATELRNRFFSTYKDLQPWYAKQKSLCNQDGGVYTLFGRFRALPDIYSSNPSEKASAERCCINTPVQSTGSDILLSSMLEIEHTLPECEIVCTVHDSILLYVPEDKVEYYKEKIGNIMRHPALLDYFNIHLTVPLDIDIGAGPWGTH